MVANVINRSSSRLLIVAEADSFAASARVRFHDVRALALALARSCGQGVDKLAR
jgi:hypothetical protein